MATDVPFINPDVKSSIGEGGNAAIDSSAPPYNPILGPGDSSTAGTPVNQIYNQEVQNAYAPTLSPQETFTYNPIVDNPQDTLSTTAQPITNQPNTATAGNAAQAATGISAGSVNTLPANTYNAAQTGAAQGTIDPNSMVQNQVQQVLTQNVNPQTGLPDWATPAVTSARQRLNSLGLGASTMAGNAETTAILQAAIPMAMQNAQVAAQLASQNLSNAQQSMLSNQAATNAALQFNAQSKNQTDEFFSGLSANMAIQNAQIASTIAQFNASQTNQVGEFNAQQKNAADQFFSNLDSQQQQFNIQNQRIVDQSNVQWQRTINTANTAGQNAANQANTQNLFNLSQSSLNNIWQEARDEASWALTSDENSQNRALSFVNSALNRETSIEILNSQLQAQMYSQLGQAGINLLGGLLGGAGGVGNGIASLFNGTGDTGAGDTGGNVVGGTLD